MKRKWSIWIGLVLVLALVAAACSSSSDDTTTTAASDTTAAADDGTATTSGDAVSQSDLRFVVVSHGQSSDPFWSASSRLHLP